MDGIASLLAQAGEMARENASRNGILTLSGLRAALKMIPPETPVVCGGKSPAVIASYRGYYERLAIGTDRDRDDYETKLHGGGPACDSEYFGHYQPGADQVTIAEPVTAAELLKALDLADGEEFEGYKGGQFAMHGGTLMHVAEYGDCGRMLVGLRLDGERAVIETAEEVW